MKPRPKRGSLKSAGKRQENATFLQRSFFNDAVQFLVCCCAAFGKNDVLIAEKRVLQCIFCSATFRKNSAQLLLFVCGMLQAWGLEGWGLRLADENKIGTPLNLSKSSAHPETRNFMGIGVFKQKEPKKDRCP